MTKYYITRSETYDVTYEVEAQNVDEALEKFDVENLKETNRSFTEVNKPLFCRPVDELELSLSDEDVALLKQKEADGWDPGAIVGIDEE